MISAIETEAISPYCAGMRSVLLRLLAFIAVMLMPFGMAPAAAAPMQDQQMAMPMHSCPERDSSRHSTGAFSACTMACASALPATDLTVALAQLVSEFLPEPIFGPALSGIELEIATPPPRLS